MADEESELLNRVLTEIAAFDVKLEPDPTLPHLGTQYLQQKLAACRNYLNRLTYYVQTIGKAERDLRVDVRRDEINIELKVMEMLADDPIVRAQSSIDDRKAVANSKLPVENKVLAEKKLRLLEVQETMKLIRMKYRDMQQVSQDIKLQRQMVKDDKDAWSHGETGYSPPGVGKDKVVQGGMQPPVKPRIDPSDLLDPSKRPDDLPPPVDAVHAKQISEFFEGSLPPSEDEKPKPEETVARVSYDDLLRD